MGSFNKRIAKRKESKITLKNHKKQTESSAQAVTQGEGSVVSRSVRPEDIKMHS